MKRSAYKSFFKRIDNYKKYFNKQNHENINEIRKIIKDHPPPVIFIRTKSDIYPIIHLGGIQ